ncbi:hypothetical protein GC176_04065 [bacterium]|nr:hypothetical protein [bacterium]
MMATDKPMTDSEIDVEILRKKSAVAEYEQPAEQLSEAEETACRYWPLTRMSILEGLQGQTVDTEAWERFVDLYGPLICEFCRKRVPAQDAAEITQEVFGRVFRYVKGLKYDRSLGSFGGWIGGITRNEIRQYLHRKRKDARGRVRGEVLRDIEARTTLGEWEDEYNAWVVSLALGQVRREVSALTWDLFEQTTNGACPKEVARRFEVKVSKVYKARWAVGDRLRQLIRSMSDDYPFADQE